jgi:recombination protein RecT
MASNTQLAIQAVGTSLKSDAFRQSLIEALPQEISIDRFTRVAITALQQNPDLLTKDRNSLFLAVRRCAEFGLNPDGREAALVAFGQSVVCMPMVGGLRRIAAKYGFNIATGVVHENDEFHYELGVDPVLRHIPAKLGTDRGKMLGAWAQAKGPDGQVYLDVMDEAAMDVVRSVSRAKNGDLWTKWKGEAWRKTVARRLWKSLPLYDLSERDSRVADARYDPEFEQEAAGAQEQPQAPAHPASRPSALDRVVASRAAAQEPAGDVIEGEFSEAPTEPAQPEPQPAAASDDSMF